MTLMTTPIDIKSAYDWGLIDAFSDNPADLLRKHLLRLRLLSRENVELYKRYSSGLPESLSEAKGMAASENAKMFSDPQRLELIRKFITTGCFPWEV
jgi:polyketide biosynthesis enoyl-CoA hydratase PksH